MSRRREGGPIGTWLPAPLQSAALFAVWLLLNNTLDPAHVVLAAVFAIVVPLLTSRMRQPRPRPKKPLTMLRLGLLVLWDIVLANIEVARRVLGPEAAITPRFVWVPLAIRAPHGILTLAAIITLTPGTLTAEVSADRRHLLVHVLHLAAGDAAAIELIAQIKARYEQPLMEIFD